ncbi:hypothetical protein FEM33_12615 [Dyadobacter flavalbus]|uniref:Uncharacterized protein n=2 Tax=Dyadobacter flavalbus TaxID=2579942 RepID=A0A5M8QWS1_9BACT|nr:hypothetical protein FEM33_12615 [Dyadobacter flavalbus]
MVEIFKTNVESEDQATLLIEQINRIFTGYQASFDLEDCDRILRVSCTEGTVQSECLIRLLLDFGFYAEILADEVYKPESAIYS